MRRILVDLDFRQLLRGLAGPQGAQVRSAASEALAARLRQAKAGGARAKKEDSLEPVRALSRQQERGQKALRVPSSAGTAGTEQRRCGASLEPQVIRGVQLQRFRGLHALPLGSAPPLLRSSAQLLLVLRSSSRGWLWVLSWV